jgi:hypothetical protein
MYRSWQIETMRNEVETRLWWFGSVWRLVVWCLRVGGGRQGFRAEVVFGVVWVVLQVARLPHVLGGGDREDDAG